MTEESAFVCVSSIISSYKASSALNLPSPPATMSDAAPSEGSGAPSRGRGKRGGFGKNVRARGRGKRFTTPAPFRVNQEEAEEEDEEEAERERIKYSRRNLGSNAARYEEKEPDPGKFPWVV
jgi:hypothetical protein